MVEAADIYDIIGDFETSELRSLLSGCKIIWPDGHSIDVQPSRKWLESLLNEENGDIEGAWLVTRCGKNAAGRILDGRTWDEFPEVVHA